MKKSRKQFIRHLIISTLGALLLYLIKGFIICYECFNSGPDFNGSPAGVVMDLLILPLSPFLAIYNFPVSLGIFNASTHPFHAFPEWLWWTIFISTQILYIYIVDRKKDMINVRGLNVYPAEIEKVLLRHPKVKEAAVVGVVDKFKGEVPKAFIVLKENETLSGPDVIKYLRKNLALFKIPKFVEFRQALPRTATGKILKRQLKGIT